MISSNVLWQGVATPDQEHGQHQEEEEGGRGGGSGLDTSKRSQLILSILGNITNIFLKL